MKISKKIEKAINDQIKNELVAQYTYMGMQAWLETTPYDGFAHWMRLQADEEHGHARKLFDYINDRYGEVALQALAAPKCAYESPLAVFEAALAHELKVTQQIHAIYELAQAEKDFATTSFLDWFLKEQIEEEEQTQDMVDKLKLAGDCVDALLRLDHEAGERGKD